MATRPFIIILKKRVTMQILNVMLQIIIVFFAIMGVYDFIRHLLDTYVQKKSGSSCKIYVESCESENVEYLIRFAESRFIFGDYSEIFDGIVLSENVKTDREVFDRLSEEYDNVFLE